MISQVVLLVGDSLDVGVSISEVWLKTSVCHLFRRGI